MRTTTNILAEIECLLEKQHELMEQVARSKQSIYHSPDLNDILLNGALLAELNSEFILSHSNERTKSGHAKIGNMKEFLKSIRSLK